MADDVNFEDVIADIITTIRKGCDQSGSHPNNECELLPEAIAFVRRRYKGSIDEKLKYNEPGDWKNKHKKEIDKVAFAHGQIAGGIWRFQKQTKPSPPKGVTAEILAKGGHIMEIECQSFLTQRRMAARRRPRKGQALRRTLEFRGGYCW